jgi:hypothetical protein
MMALRDIALSTIVTGVTISIGLVILAKFLEVIDAVEGGAGTGTGYVAINDTINAVVTLPDWLSIYVVAGAGFAILGLILAGLSFGRAE